jgi:DNA-binding MarR family transcriptional regulator
MAWAEWYVQNVNVQKMNGQKNENQDRYKSLLLLDEISKGEPLSQRDISKKLNIALGLVNSYIRNLVSKGYITISTIPAKRYAYYLTPKGFSEKTRLTYQLLQDYTNIYKGARRDFRKLFHNLSSAGVKSVAFAGVDEVAEIAYLSLQEVDIELAGAFDDAKTGMKFFKTVVRPIQEIQAGEYDRVVLSTYLRRKEIYQRLRENGVAAEHIITIYDIHQ